MRRLDRGFSLVEVLVALLVVAIGALGMLALQGRAVQHMTEAHLRGNAVMLANELLELMRSNREAVLDASGGIDAGSAYFKAAGTGLPATPARCGERDRSAGGRAVAEADLGCWGDKVRRLLPVTETILNGRYLVCRSSDSELCSSGAGSVVMIRMAWVDERSGLCADGVCGYVLRAEL